MGQGADASPPGTAFGMDGLRLRADREQHWQTDVHLTAAPSEVLSALGYPPALPWFDTYDRLWRFILSSPLAGAWMFMPAATNGDNRSRDQRRRTIGDFQEWLATNFPGQLEAPAPRATPQQAQGWVRARWPAIGIDAVLDLQQRRYEYARLRTRLLGTGAVADVIGDGHPPELMGEIVHAMQALLPPKAEREAAMGDPVGWGEMIGRAREAARVVAEGRGMATRGVVGVPGFVAEP